MGNLLERYMSRRRNRSSNSSEDSNNSLEKKKAKNQVQNSSMEEEGEDILKALTMSNCQPPVGADTGKVEKIGQYRKCLGED